MVLDPVLLWTHRVYAASGGPGLADADFALLVTAKRLSYCNGSVLAVAGACDVRSAAHESLLRGILANPSALTSKPDPAAFPRRSTWFLGGR